MVAITAAFVFVIRDFLMTIFVAAIFSALAHPLYWQLRTVFRGREAVASAVTLLMIVLLVGGPLVFIASIVTAEAVRMTDNVTPFVRQLIDEPTSINAYLDRIPGIERLAPYREMLLTKAGETAGTLGTFVRVIAHKHDTRHPGAGRRLLHDALRDVLLLDQGPPLSRFHAAVPAAPRGRTGAHAAAIRFGHPRNAQGVAPHRHCAGCARWGDAGDSGRPARYSLDS